MYTWNKSELLAKKILASILRKPLYKEHYDLILRQLHLEQQKFKPDEILVGTKKEIINYKEALNNFASGLNVLSEDTYTSLAEIFLMIEDHNAFKIKNKLIINIKKNLLTNFHIKTLYYIKLNIFCIY